MVVADTKALTLDGEEEEGEARTFLWTRRGGKVVASGQFWLLYLSTVRLS